MVKQKETPKNMILNNAMKHLSVITKSANDARPVLKLVHFDNGNMMACDSYRALILKSPFGEDFTGNVDMTTLSASDDFQYPNIEQLKLTKTTSLSVVLDFELSNTSLKLITALKSDEHLFLSSNDKGELEILSGDQKIVLATIPTDLPDFKIEPIAFSPKRFIDLINALIDLKDHAVTFLYKPSPVMPVQFSVDGFDYILTPMRLGK